MLMRKEASCRDMESFLLGHISQEDQFLLPAGLPFRKDGSAHQHIRSSRPWSTSCSHGGGSLSGRQFLNGPPDLFPRVRRDIGDVLPTQLLEGPTED